MNQHRTGFCFIKIRRSSKEWKEISTSASLAGHCYNADDRLIKKLQQFWEWHAVWMCLLFDWSMLFFILSAFIQKQAQLVAWEGSKIILSFSYKNEPYTLLLFRRGSNKVKRFFFCQSPVAAFPGCRRTYEGWHEGKLSIWIMSVVFGASFLLNWLLTTIVCPTHPTAHWGNLVVHPHQYFAVLNLVLRLWILVRVKYALWSLCCK